MAWPIRWAGGVRGSQPAEGLPVALRVARPARRQGRAASKIAAFSFGLGVQLDARRLNRLRPSTIDWGSGGGENASIAVLNAARRLCRPESSTRRTRHSAYLTPTGLRWFRSTKTIAYCSRFPANSGTGSCPSKTRSKRLYDHLWNVPSLLTTKMRTPVPMTFNDIERLSSRSWRAIAARNGGGSVRWTIPCCRMLMCSGTLPRPL